MVSYLTEQLHMPVVKAATTVTNFGGTASLTPLLGAFLADAYIGRFWAIAAASFIYLIVSHQHALIVVNQSSSTPDGNN